MLLRGPAGLVCDYAGYSPWSTPYFGEIDYLIRFIMIYGFDSML
jgi:hypothetical protein